MIDYKEKIIERWPKANTAERREEIMKWLDHKDPGWRDNYSGTIPAETVLREAIGDDAYDKWDLETSIEAEEFVMEYYLMESSMA